MSELLDLLLGKDNQQAVDELSRSFNLPEDQTRKAMEGLIPALTRGLQKNTQNGPGMDELLEALKTGRHDRYVDRPETLGTPQTTDDGNGILGHIFGTKEVSREVANRVSKQAGIPSALLKKMLPIVASLVMGSLSKRVLGGSKSRSASGGLLSSLLDSDRDGSIWDDVLGMAARSLLR